MALPSCLYLFPNAIITHPDFSHSLIRRNDEIRIIRGAHNQQALYLWPDRLRWHFWLIGLVLGFIFYYSRHIWLALIGLVWMTFVVPSLVYWILRIPVLDYA